MGCLFPNDCGTIIAAIADNFFKGTLFIHVKNNDRVEFHGIE